MPGEMNEAMAVFRRAVSEVRQEHAIAYVEYVLRALLKAVGITTEDFLHGGGKRETPQWRLYEKVYGCN